MTDKNAVAAPATPLEQITAEFDNRMDYILSNAEGFAKQTGLPFDRQQAREAMVAQLATRSRAAASAETSSDNVSYTYRHEGVVQMNEIIARAQRDGAIETDTHSATGGALYTQVQLAISAQQFRSGGGPETGGNNPPHSGQIRATQERIPG